MSIVCMSDVRAAANELSREQLDSLIFNAGAYDKDQAGDGEYAEQLELGRALADARRREAARARRARFF